jgi:hypothetical protein
MGSDHDFYGHWAGIAAITFHRENLGCDCRSPPKIAPLVKGIAAMSSLATVGLVETEHEPSGRFVVRTKRSESD